MTRFAALLPRRTSPSAERPTMTPSAAFLTDLQFRLAQAVTERDATAARMAQLSYNAEAGLPEADAALTEATDKLALADRRIGKLQAAITIAETRLADAEAAAHAAERAEQVARFTAAMTTRDEAVRRCQEAMAAAVTAWYGWIAATEALTAALPPGTVLPGGLVATLGEAVTAAKAELYRLGGNPAHPALSFPGGHVNRWDQDGNPKLIPPLLDVIADASAATLRHVSAPRSTFGRAA